MRDNGRVRIDDARTFPVSLERGFDYIVNPANWPEYWPDLVRVEEGGTWQLPGDKMSLVIRLLGRETKLELTLERKEPYWLVEYRSVQGGFPDAHHERHFAGDDQRLDYRIVVELEPRRGFRGVFDRVVVPRGVRRAVATTLDNLDDVFRTAGQS
jgi:Polyketide cyclase / dehydrase and lipid transport